jgi:hypothetical protein
VREHQHCVRKHAGQRIEREHVFRRFQDPASRRIAPDPEVTKELRQEPVALLIARRAEPFLRGVGLYRMQVS